MRVSCWGRGVTIKKGARYYGVTSFKRARYSKIIIGAGCIFRSIYNSNLLGINKPCIFSALEKDSVLTIGNGCGFSGTVIGCFKEITIGDNVRCGANTVITDSDWHLNDKRIGEPKTVIIENNVWIGANVIVLKGVHIGENSIIGAGSIVVKDIPKNVIAGGNPCKVLKSI